MLLQGLAVTNGNVWCEVYNTNSVHACVCSHTSSRCSSRGVTARVCTSHTASSQEGKHSCTVGGLVTGFKGSSLGQLSVVTWRHRHSCKAGLVS